MNIVAEFAINHTQFLSSEGDVTQSLPEWTADTELLIKMYKMMHLVRTFDSKAIKLQRTGKLGTYASTLGQEAISVGYGAAMEPQDVMAPYYRDYGAQLWRGVKMSELYTYWGGNEFGNCYSDNAHDLPMSVPIASQNLHAVGVAKAFQYRKQPHAVITSVGDGGTSEGDFYEALNVAGIWQLPVVFIVNNNQWAISVPRDAQTGSATFAQKAIAAGIDGEQVDGNDVIAMYDRTKAALDKARQGGGATVIEAITYRLCDHTTADDAKRYCPEEKLTAAWQQEPIKRLRQWLIANDHWNDDKETAWQQDCKQQVNQAVDDYLNTPKPSPEAMLDYLYATLPDALQEQRQQLMEEK